MNPSPNDLKVGGGLWLTNPWFWFIKADTMVEIAKD
jgi:hypothetical protein